MDWDLLSRVGAIAAGRGDMPDGPRLSALRSRLSDHVAEARTKVAAEAQLPTDPPAELVVVDRAGWIAGNVETFKKLIGELPVPAAASKLLAAEGGALLGLVARAVLAQYDPYRDLLIVVAPNLAPLGSDDGLRWLIYHEVTHLAQFRGAPWMSEYISSRAGTALETGDRAWMRDAGRRFMETLPRLAPWLRDVLAGRPAGDSPLLALLPPEQLATLRELNSMLTVLEGHATWVGDSIGERDLPDYAGVQQRMREARKRPPWLRVLEALLGLEMKRQQYVKGKEFCERIWEIGGPATLAPFFASPANTPTSEELADPPLWVERVA